MFEYATESRSVLNEELLRAFDSFERRTCTPNAALRLMKRVANIRFDASDERGLEDLENEILKFLKYVRQRSSAFSLGATAQRPLVANATSTSASVKGDKKDLESEADKHLIGTLKDALTAVRTKRSLLLRCGRRLMNPSDFEFLRPLCKGGFATVYLTRRVDSVNRYCAMKVMQKSYVREQRMVKQAMREKHVMAAIARSDGRLVEMFVRLLAAFQTTTHLFLAMEYLPGGDCLSMVTTMRRFPEVLAKQVLAEVVLAVTHLHQHGVVHRDIKPDNFLISSRGHVKLGDFGMAAPWDMSAITNRMNSSSSASAATGTGSGARTGTGAGSVARARSLSEVSFAIEPTGTGTRSQLIHEDRRYSGMRMSYDDLSSDNSSVRGEHLAAAARNLGVQKRLTIDSLSSRNGGAAVMMSNSLGKQHFHRKSSTNRSSSGVESVHANMNHHHLNPNSPEHLTLHRKAPQLWLEPRPSPTAAATGTLSRSQSVFSVGTLGTGAESERSSVTDYSLAFQPRSEEIALMRSAIGGNFMYACPEAVINTGYDHTG
jgi:serine/threonine protein kinase